MIGKGAALHACRGYQGLVSGGKPRRRIAPLQTLGDHENVGAMEPENFLRQGQGILAAKLGPLGYWFEIVTPATSGSGGPFAEASFMREDREIRLWVRYGRLGGVTYRIGNDEFGHKDYMRALGRAKTAEYPGFDDGDPLGGFKRLLRDLEYCGEFLTGDATGVAEKVKALPPRPAGLKALG